MPATKPEDVDYELARAFNRRDLEACCALYEDEASVVRLRRDGGTVAKGSEGIREVMAGYVGLNPRMDIFVHNVTQSGDIALLRSQWLISGTDRAGKPTVLAHNGMEVVRRQRDGAWKFVIDHPFAADPYWEIDWTELMAVSKA
jgi:ketosteroid isomerase-like protein